MEISTARRSARHKNIIFSILAFIARKCDKNLALEIKDVGVLAVPSSYLGEFINFTTIKATMTSKPLTLIAKNSHSSVRS